MRKIKLPNKPSALITLALGDMIKAEKMPTKYVIEMSGWHNLMGKRCLVCAAGCVMAFSLKSDPGRDFYPESFDFHTSLKLRAIDCFRSGNITNGLRYMGISENFENRPIRPYYSYRVQFKKDMRKLAHDLKKVGL